MLASISLGLRYRDGTRDECVVSPGPDDLEAAAAVVCEQAEWVSADWVTWVDGDHAELCAMVAERLRLPVGRPSAPGEADEPAEAADADHEHRWVYDARQTLKWFGSPKLRRGKAFICLVEGCAATSVRARH